MALPEVLNKIVSWLRAGYPEGVPRGDYIPLFALLGTHLSDDEITLIADELSFAADPESATAMKAAINSVTKANPTDADVARVRARLAAGGWPLATPDEVS